MNIHIGADHAGFELKEHLRAYLNTIGYQVVDHGAFSYVEGDDFPDYIEPVAQAVAATPGTFGIVIGGSGQGEAMDANRFAGVRATEYYGGNLEIVRVSRQHNDANVLSLGARFMDFKEAEDACAIFITTVFSGDDRHARRIEKMDN